MKKLLVTPLVLLILMLAPVAIIHADSMDAGIALQDASPDPVAAPVVEPAPLEEAPAALEEAILESEPKVSEDPVLARLASNALELVGTLLMLVMAWALKKAGSFFTAKSNIEIPAKTEAMIAEWGRKGVYYANEKAHQYLKEHGEAMETSKKVEYALGFGLSLAEEYGLMNLAKDKLVKYTESHLGEARSAPMLTAIAGEEVE